MSDLRVSNLRGRTSGSSPTLPDGAIITGISTLGFTTFSSDAWVSGALTVGGNLKVTGDITYDEVTGVNINISGIATVGSAVTMSVSGIHASSGIVTASAFEGSGAKLTGLPAGFTELDAALFN
tara:strand:+ start:124 stop:495 length:372 start_codon:yes stop_codon:yes gene_type:complete